MSNTGNTNTNTANVSGYGHNRGPSMPFTGSVIARNNASGVNGIGGVQVQQGEYLITNILYRVQKIKQVDKKIINIFRLKCINSETMVS